VYVVFFNNFEGLYFLVPLRIGPQAVRCSYGIAEGCFADVVLHSSKKYHHEHATEPRRLPKTFAAAWGAAI